MTGHHWLSLSVTQFRKKTFFINDIAHTIIRDAEYEYDVRIEKFKIAYPKWPTKIKTRSGILRNQLILIETALRGVFLGR